MGTNASELIHTGQAFLQLRATATQIAETLFNYPTLSDLYRHAALEALANRPDDRARRIAVGALDDESENVRARAIRLIAIHGDTGDAGVVRGLLADSLDIWRRH